MKDDVRLELDDIPHGHGKSFRTGVRDVLDNYGHTIMVESKVPNGHQRSYRRGVELGKILRQQINSFVKEYVVLWDFLIL